MRRYDAVLFDFDGTLADSFAAITASVNHVLAHYGREQMSEQHVRGLVGHGLLQLMEQIAPGENPEEAARIYRDHHPSVMGPLTTFLPGVEEALPALHQAGVKMAVCSNKPSRFTRELLEYLEIAPFFLTCLGPEEAGKPKPAPEMLFLACRLAEVAPEKTLYIGDMTVDIETAKNANIPIWAVATGSQDEQTLRLAQPDRLLPNLKGIAEMILAIGASD